QEGGPMRRYVFRLTFLACAVLGTSVVLGNDQQIAKAIVEKLTAEKQAGSLKGFNIELKVEQGDCRRAVSKVSTSNSKSNRETLCFRAASLLKNKRPGRSTSPLACPAFARSWTTWRSWPLRKSLSPPGRRQNGR